jgi:diguanylate cyclase (GGDEF)-like protein
MEKRILVVEDSSFLAQYLKKEISGKLQIPVTLCASLFEARRELQRDSAYTAAILDYNLPDAPQGEIIKEITFYKIPAIVYTSTINKSIREKVWSQRVSDYILKSDEGSLGDIITTLKRLESNKSKKIIICDDSSFFRKLLGGYLELQNYQVLHAGDGDECLELLALHPETSVVISDYSMPKYNGCELCQKIRKNYNSNELSIIGISSEDEKDMAVQFLKCGANDFIEKQTFLPEEFLCRVSQNVSMVDLFRKNKTAAERDFLTGLYNRRMFFELGEALLHKHRDKYFLCAMIDIDFFKKINDVYGHQSGDEAIRHLAKNLGALDGPDTIIARIGGEEFILLQAVEPESAPQTRLEELRDYIEKTGFLVPQHPEPLRYTISIGCILSEFQELSSLIKISDEQLYISKESGRNRLTLLNKLT